MSATSPGCTAYAADHTVARFRIETLARLSSANSIGMIMGPVMAGLVAGLGLLAPLVVASFLSGIAAIVVALGLSKGVHAPRRHKISPSRIGYFDCASPDVFDLGHRRFHRLCHGAANAGLSDYKRRLGSDRHRDRSYTRVER